MFSATFLGHHSWVFASERTHLLVNPLFRDRTLHTDAVGFTVFPPRRVDLSAFPALDAIVITHEHEGHLDVPSLAHVDRRIPLYIPALSSIAMRDFLKGAGFDVRLIHPGRPVEVGELVVHPMACDQVNTAIIDEWDIFAYLVRDKAGHGSLFTHVDMTPTEAMFEAARAVVERPGLWAYTNNQHDTYFQRNWQPPDRDGLRHYAATILNYHDRLLRWARPEALLLVGGGFTFGGDMSWMNPNAFPWTSEDVKRALDALLPDDRVEYPAPGQRFVMRSGKLVALEDKTPYAAALPRSEWPSRAFRGDVKWLESYSPACGKTEFQEADLPALQAELDGFAGYLYGGDLFKQLCSLSDGDLRERKKTFAIALKADKDGGAFVFEYELQGCRFVPVTCDDPASEYLAVFECWATDLLSFFRSDLSTRALAFGRCREWNANPMALRFDVVRVLFDYVHPLRLPARFQDFYTRLFAATPAPPSAQMLKPARA